MNSEAIDGPTPFSDAIVTIESAALATSTASFHRGSVAAAPLQLGMKKRQDHFFRIVDNIKQMVAYQTIQGDPMNSADYMIQNYAGHGDPDTSEAIILPVGLPKVVDYSDVSFEKLSQELQVWQIKSTHHYPPAQLSSMRLALLFDLLL